MRTLPVGLESVLRSSAAVRLASSSLGHGRVPAQQRQTGLRQQPLVLLVVVLLFCSAMVASPGLDAAAGGRPVFVSWRMKTASDWCRVRRSAVGLLDRQRDACWPPANSATPCMSSPASCQRFGLARLCGIRLASLLLNLKPDVLDQRRQKRGVDRDGYRTTLALNLQARTGAAFPGAGLEHPPGCSGGCGDPAATIPHGTLASHALGYTQPITEEEYEIAWPRRGTRSVTVSVARVLKRRMRPIYGGSGAARCSR